jgi:hypothetical protein
LDFFQRVKLINLLSHLIDTCYNIMQILSYLMDKCYTLI